MADEFAGWSSRRHRKSAFTGEWVGEAGRNLLVNAQIATEWDARQQSVLAPFVSFVADAAHSAGVGELPLEQLQEVVEERFGLRIDLHPLRAIVRLAKRRLGVLECRGDRVVVHRERINGLTMLPLRRQFLNAHRAVVARLREFAAVDGVQIDEVAAEQALSAFVEQRAALVMLRQPVEWGPFPESGDAGADLDFVIARYVNHIREHDDEAFHYLVTVVQGAMHQWYLHLGDLSAFERSLRHSTVLLDTRIVLRLLGLEGPQLEAPAREMRRLLEQCKARVACFERTVDEARRVLRAVAARFLEPGRSEAEGHDLSAIEEHFLATATPPSEIEMIATRLDEIVRAEGIEIVPDRSDPVAPRRVERSELIEALGYAHERACEHDADASLDVFHRRAGTSPRLNEECVAVFVTPNAQHVDQTGRVLGRNGDNGRWPFVMLDQDLATLLWLKRPLDDPRRRKNLPRKRIMADCYAAMRPTQELLDRFVETVDRLASSGAGRDDDFRTLRLNLAVRDALMDQTHGDVRRVDEDRVETVLDVVHGATRVGPDVDVLLQRLAQDRERDLGALEDLIARQGRALRKAVSRELVHGVEGEVRRRLEEERSARRERYVHGLTRAVFWMVAIPLLLVSPGVAWVGGSLTAGASVTVIELGLVKVVGFVWGEGLSVRSGFTEVEQRVLRAVEGRRRHRRGREQNEAPLVDSILTGGVADHPPPSA